MRQFAVIKNADTDEIFAIAIKSEDNLIHCMGIHPAGRQWAKSYNQGLTKSLTDDLQPGIFTGDFAPLTSTMQAVIDEAMEGKSVRFPDRSRLVFFDSIDHRHTQVVPQIKDAGLHNLNLKDLKKGADYKGMTFRVDSARSSVLFKTRQGQYGYDIQGIGFISRKIDKKVLQEELTNTALGYGNVRRAVKAVAERKCIMLDGHDGYMPLDEEKFVAPVRTKANRLGRRLGGGGKGGVRKIGRSMKDPFDPKAWDGDGDGIVQEGTMWERPAIPGINTNLPGQPKTRTKPKDSPDDTQRERKRRADAKKPRRDPNRYHPGAAGRARRRSRLDQRRRIEGAGMRSMYGNDPDAPFPTPADERAFDAYMKRIDGMTVNELFDMDGISYPSDRLLGQLIDEHGWDLEEDGADVDKPLSELLKEAGGVKTGSTASKLFAELEDDFWDDPSKFMNIDEGPDPYDVWKDRQMDDDASGGMRSQRGSSTPDPLWQGPDGDPYRAEQLEEVWQDRVNDVMDEQGLSEEDAIEFLAANPDHGLAPYERGGMRSERRAQLALPHAGTSIPSMTPEQRRQQLDAMEIEIPAAKAKLDSLYEIGRELNADLEHFRGRGADGRPRHRHRPGGPTAAERGDGMAPSGRNRDTHARNELERLEKQIATNESSRYFWDQKHHQWSLQQRELLKRENSDRSGMRSFRDDYEPDPMDLAKALREDRLMREHTAHLTSDELIQLNETLAEVLAVFEGSIYGPDEEDPDFARILKLKEAIEVALDAQDVIEIGDGMDIDDTIGTLLRVYDGVGEPWPEISDVISVLEMARDNRDGEYVSPTLTERGYMLSDEDRAVDGGMRSRRGGEPSRRETPRRQELRKMSVNELRDDDSVPDEALEALENTFSAFPPDDPIFHNPIEDVIEDSEPAMYFGPDDLERLLDIADPPPGDWDRGFDPDAPVTDDGDWDRGGMRSQRFEPADPLYPAGRFDPDHWPTFGGDPRLNPDGSRRLQDDGRVLVDPREHLFKPGERMRSRSGFDPYAVDTDSDDYVDPAEKKRVAREKRLQKEFEGVSDRDLEEELGELESADMLAEDDPNTLQDIKDRFGSLKKMQDRLNKLWEETDRRDAEKEERDAPSREEQLRQNRIAAGMPAEGLTPRRSQGGMRSRVDSQRARHAQRTGADDSNESYRWGGSPRPDSEEYERRVEQVQRGGTRARQRDAATDAAAMPRGRGGMRSRRPNRGRNRPGLDRASKRDGQIWENLTPEERKAVVEAAKVEMHRLMWGLTWNDIGVNDTRKSGAEGVSNIGNAVIRYWFNEHIRPGLSEEAAKNYVFTDENIEQIKSAIERNVSDGILKSITAESMEKLLNRFDSLRTYRNMAEASEKDGDEAFAFLEHLSPSARDSLYKRAAGPDQDRLRKRAALRWNKNPSTRDESLESRQGEVGRLAGTRRGRVGSWTRDMAKRIMIPNPETVRRRALKAQKKAGGSGGGFTREQRRRSAIERAMSKARRKARSLLRGKKDQKKVLAEADKNMSHKVVKVDADGKVTLGDIKQFSKALKAYRREKDALKVKVKKGSGEELGEDIADARNRDLAIMWEVHGMNGLPILVSESELMALIDEGWTLMSRGHGRDRDGADNAENWLTDELRFLPGSGGQAYGPGEYWSTEGDWGGFRHHEHENTTVGVIPPTARVIKQSDTTKEANANKRITDVFDLVGSTYPGDEIEHADPKELAAQIRAEFDKADARNWETEVGQLWQRLLEAMEAGDPDSINAMLMFKKISRAESNLIAPALGYDIIDAGSVQLVMNRSVIVALDGAVNEGGFQKFNRIDREARADRRER